MRARSLAKLARNRRLLLKAGPGLAATAPRVNKSERVLKRRHSISLCRPQCARASRVHLRARARGYTERARERRKPSFVNNAADSITIAGANSDSTHADGRKLRVCARANSAARIQTETELACTLPKNNGQKRARVVAFMPCVYLCVCVRGSRRSRGEQLRVW